MTLKGVAIPFSLKPAMLLAAVWMVTVAPAHGKQKDRAPAESGLNRATCYRLLSLYGLGDPQSIAEANQILDSVLPHSESAAVDPEDKFTHDAAVTFYRLHGAKLPPPLRERSRWDIVRRVKAIEQHYYPQRRTNFHMGHTNFALLYLEAFVLGSEVIDDEAARQKAYESFHEFCDYTLHYWPSQGWLTGANARTYSYVGGLGGAASLVRPFLVGDPSRISPEERKKSPPRHWETSGGGTGGWVALFDYEPPQYIGEIAREKCPTIYRGLWLAPEPDEFRRGCEGDDDFQRTAHGEFGHQYGKDRYTYIEPVYALGSGGAHYSGQERMLVADIASKKDMASISSQINTSVPLDCKDDFSELKDGVLTICWKGQSHRIDLRRP